MKCFYHRDLDAIGMCKSCHKGVCENCAVEVGQSIACKNQCEEKASVIDAMISKSIVTIDAQKKNRMFMPAFFIVIGLVFVTIELVKKGHFGTSTIMGGVFVLFGVALLVINRVWVKNMEAKS